ncbi:MAG: hypothetical protein KF726_03640 [Anaerolineae bacterium]|nr:hypothetical protein [Anaerolineae bacterium]
MKSRSLPIPSTPLIGRTGELTELARRLSEARLVTLLAPSGMGKTRLAIEVARRLAEADAIENGVFFVPLPENVALNALIDGIATSLGYTFHQELPPRQQLLSYFGAKRCLLVLDTIDGVADDAVPLIEELTAQEQTVLITSPKRLSISSEVVYQLKGLSVEAASTLFVATAKQLQPSFEVNAVNATSIARICEYLGGMPLGILFAAAWIEVLSPQEIAQEIAADLDFLHTEWRDLPLHQHSLKDVLRFAWFRLSPAEQQLLMQLSVFKDGFTRTAAQHVANAQLADLRMLIGRALMWHDPDTGRYHFHELLRRYGESQLVAQTQRSEVDIRQRHTAYFAALVHDQAERLHNHYQVEAAQCLNADWENIAAAWSWALAIGDTVALDKMIEPLAIYFNMESKWDAGEAFFRLAVEAWRSKDDVIAARLTLCAVQLLLLSRDPATFPAVMLNQLEEAVQRTFDQLILHEHRALADFTYGHLLIVTEEYEEARTSLYRSLQRYHDSGRQYWEAQVLHLLGFLYVKINDETQAMDCAQQCCTIARALGDINSLSMFLINAGSYLMWQGQFAEARRCFEESLQYGQQHTNWSRVLWAEQCLGSLAFYTTDLVTVRQSSAAVISMSRQYGYRAGMEFGTHNLYMAALAESDYASAWQICADAEWLSQRERAFGLALAALGMKNYRVVREYLTLVLSDGDLNQKIMGLGGAACVLASTGDLQFAAELLSLATHSSRRVHTLMERLPLFSAARREIEQRLPPHLFAEHWMRGRSLEVDSTVAHVIHRLRDTVGGLVGQHLLTTAKTVDALSARELEILQLIASGFSNQAIADRLIIGESTVKKHITHIYSKLGVNSRTQALIRARDGGIL